MIRNKKLSLTIIIILIIALLIGFFCYIYLKKENEDFVPTNKATDTSLIDFEIKSFVFDNNSPSTIINALLKNINEADLPFQFSKQKKASLWWISNDDWNIIDKTASSIISSETTFDRNRAVTSTISNKLNTQISKIFLDNGFAKNFLNSSKSQTDKSFYDYILAFQKNKTNCILKVNRDNGKYSITCADNFQEAYNQQIFYLKGLNLKNAAIYDIEKNGNFAKLGISLRRTGYFSIIKIVDNKVEEVFKGQESPSCDLMEKNKVPLELYKNCFIDNVHLKY